MAWLCCVHQLTVQYKDKRRVVDDLKEELQKKINDYTKFTESGESQVGSVFLMTSNQLNISTAV